MIRFHGFLSLSKYGVGHLSAYCCRYLLFPRRIQNKVLTAVSIGYSEGLFCLHRGGAGEEKHCSLGEGLSGVWGNMKTRSFISKDRGIF